MKRAILVAILILLCFNAAAEAAGFPRRPLNVSTQTVQGVLVAYQVGDAAGGFTIKSFSGKSFVFDIAKPAIMNGKVVRCMFPPDYKVPATKQCPDWPANVVLGTSLVTVTFWIDATTHLQTSDTIVINKF